MPEEMVNLTEHIAALHNLHSMLDEEKRAYNGSLNSANVDGWNVAYVKAKTLRNMLDTFIRDLSPHLPTRKPRRFF
jgi:hypothetical protein